MRELCKHCEHLPSLSWGRGSASFKLSRGPPSRRRLLMCRFMALCSSVLVKLAFSWASMYFSRSLRISARAWTCVWAAWCASRAAVPPASCRACSPASSASSTSFISLSDDSTSVKTPERPAEQEAADKYSEDYNFSTDGAGKKHLAGRTARQKQVFLCGALEVVLG